MMDELPLDEPEIEPTPEVDAFERQLGYAVLFSFMAVGIAWLLV